MNRKVLFCFLLLCFFSYPLFSLTIFDIQHTTEPGGDSPYLDSVVTVTGIATVSQSIFSAQEYYIQDGGGPWNGIMIYDTDTTRGIVEGDLIEVTGKVNEYYGKTEIGYLDDVEIISQGNELPQSHIIPTDSVNNEPYEGMLIRCDDAVVTDLPDVYGEWRIDDGSGKCWVDDQADYSYSPSLDDTIMHIIGIVNYSYDNFKIEPRGDRDIIFTVDGFGTVTVSPDEVTSDSVCELSFLFENSFGTLQQIELTTPQFWTWTGNAQDIILSGEGFANAQFSVVKNESLDIYIIEIDSAEVDEVNSGKMVIKNLTSPNSLGFYTFEVRTAGPGGNLEPIAESPQVLVTIGGGIIPISAIDRNDEDGVPYLLNSYVKIKGVVTVADEFDEQAFIQDATGGICVYGISDFLAKGDTAIVSGTVYQFNGLTELSPATFVDFSGRGDLPAPEIVTCYSIANDGAGGIEEYEGELVIIRGVTTDVFSFPSDGNFIITDSSGSCEVRIKKETELPGAEVPDGVFDIIGIVGQYKYSSPYDTGYQIMPRGFQDIIKRGDGSGMVDLNPSFVSAEDTSFLEFVFSADFDTINKVAVTIPLEWYWSGSLEDVSLTGDGFVSASIENIIGDGIAIPFEIVVKDAAVSADAVGVITIFNLSPLNQVGKFSFPVKTAVDPGFLEEIYKSPSVWSTNKIVDVQEPGYDGYSSAMEGDSAYVYGIVTGPSSSFSSGEFNSFYAQDETGGINIYSGEGRGFHLGERVVVAGIVTEYKGLTEVSTYPEKINLLDGTSSIIPFILSLNQGCDEKLEGRLVRVENGIISTNPSVSGSGQNFQIYNGRTVIDIRVNNEVEIDMTNIHEGDRINITGIAGQYDTEEPFSSGYQLLPRFTGDIEVLGEGGNPGPFSLFIYPNPFSPDLGEIANIEVNSPNTADDKLTLKIFDLKGRLVEKVFSNIPGGSSTHYWYGRDSKYRDVPPGIYIAHLELLMANGTVKTINKSIVVGNP